MDRVTDSVILDRQGVVGGNLDVLAAHEREEEIIPLPCGERLSDQLSLSLVVDARCRMASSSLSTIVGIELGLVARNIDVKPAEGLVLHRLRATPLRRNSWCLDGLGGRCGSSLSSSANVLLGC